MERLSAVPRYAVLGCLTLDSVITERGQRFRRVCGGNALYAAAGTHVWDSSVGIVTRVGADYPADCLDRVRESGIDLTGLRRLDEPHGLLVAFAYRADGSRTRTIPPELLATVPEEDRAAFTDKR